MTLCILHAADNRPEATVGLLCGKHRAKMDKITAEVNMLWCELALIIDGSAPRESSMKQRPRKQPEAPAPLDLAAAALRDPRNGATVQSGDIPSVMGVVSSWVLLVAEERPLTATLPSSVVAQLALLALHHDWIAAQTWVDDYVSELSELVKALRLAVNDREFVKVGTCDLPIQGPAPCDCYCHANPSASCTITRSDVGCGPHEMIVVGTCGGSLMRRNGSSVVECRDCGESWVTPQQQAYLAVRLG